MFGHDYVTQQGELISGTHSAQDLHENRAVGGIAERGTSTVATARDEMQVFQVVVAMEAARHTGILARAETKVVGRKKSPTLAQTPGEDGAPGTRLYLMYRRDGAILAHLLTFRGDPVCLLFLAWTLLISTRC